MAEETIVNKIKQNTRLVTLDLQKFHEDTSIAELDIKDFLFRELMLKEQDFRDNLKEFDWSKYEGKYLAIYCSTDAIIAPWAWMLVAAQASDYAVEVWKGTPVSLRHELYRRKLDNFDWSLYDDKFVLLKGCGDVPVPDSVYLMATNKLKGTAKKIMYGEACSNVPVWRG